MIKTAFTTAAFAVAAISAPLSAATTISITSQPNPCNVSECSFAVDGQTTDAVFSGSGAFTLPMRGAVSSSLSNIRISTKTNIDFTSITLTDPLGNVTPFALTRTGPIDRGTLLNLATMPGTYMLTVAGTSGGNAAFGGNISFAGVPEASTWAMLIAGFGVIGFAMRRRNTGAHARRPQLKFI